MRCLDLEKGRREMLDTQCQTFHFVPSKNLKLFIFFVSIPDPPEDSSIMTESSILESQIELLHIGKHVPEPDITYLCDEKMLEFKRNYWNERIGNIKRVVAPMVDQR